MTLWPQGLAGRVAFALALAAVGVGALAFAVQENDAAAAAAARPLPSPPPSGLGFLLAPSQGTVLLATRWQAIGPQVAPVVQVLADGSVALRRPAALPRHPEAPFAIAGAGDLVDAAILLPGRSLLQMGPGARGALVELLGQLVAPRPLPLARVAAVDLDCKPAELAALLLWVR